jgi:hypothetical protein
MKNLLLLVIAFHFSGLAQDKLFLRNGSVITGDLISIGKEILYFKKIDTSGTLRINRSDAILLSDDNGKSYVFAAELKEKNKTNNNPSLKRNFLGAQPLGLLFGRATFVYERLNKNGNVGLVLPFSLTFDPFGKIYNSRLDTTTGRGRIPGIKFIAGIDINFYPGSGEPVRFFFGPRVRYGTDLFLRSIEAYTYQTQLGWRFTGNEIPVVHHLSVGFGFVRIVSAPTGNLINPRQSFGWLSLNYRVSLRW